MIPRISEEEEVVVVVVVDSNMPDSTSDLSGMFEIVNLDDSIEIEKNQNILNNDIPKRKQSIFQRTSSIIGFSNMFKKNIKVHTEEDNNDKPIKRQPILQKAAKDFGIMKEKEVQVDNTLQSNEINKNISINTEFLTQKKRKKSMFQSFMGYLSPNNSPSNSPGLNGKPNRKLSIFQTFVKSTGLKNYTPSSSECDDDLIKPPSNEINIENNDDDDDVDDDNNNQTNLELLGISKLPLNDPKKKPFYYWKLIKKNIKRIIREDRDEIISLFIEEKKRIEDRKQLEFEEKQKIETEILELKEKERREYEYNNPVLTVERVWDHYTELKQVEKVEVIKKIDYLLSKNDKENEKENQVKYDEYIISILGENNKVLKNILNKLARKGEQNSTLTQNKLKVLEEINEEAEILKREKNNSMQLLIENETINRPNTAPTIKNLSIKSNSNKTTQQITSSSSQIVRPLTSTSKPLSPLARPLSTQGKLQKLQSTNISLLKPLSPILISSNTEVNSSKVENISIEDYKNHIEVESPLGLSSPILGSTSHNQLGDLDNKLTLVFEDDSYCDDNINDNINVSNLLRFSFDDFNNSTTIDCQIEKNININEEEEYSENIDPKSLHNSSQFYSESPSPFDCPPCMKPVDKQESYKKILSSPKLIHIPTRDERKAIESKEVKIKKKKYLMV
jgi:hypothetical protein